MKRILLSAADRRDGVYWHDGEPFTGVGFEPGSDGIAVRASLFEAGRFVGPYVSECDPGGGGEPAIDLQGSSGDYEPSRYQGVPFNGMGYELGGGWCDYEGYFRGGAAVSHICWGWDGSITEYSVEHDRVSEGCTWHAGDGRVESYHLFATTDAPDPLGFELGFTEDGRLRTLNLVGADVLASMAELTRRARHAPVTGTADLVRLVCAERLMVSGAGAGTGFFASLAGSGGLRHTRELILWRTAVAELGPAVLGGMPELRVLEVKSDNPTGRALAEAAKAARPAVTVVLDGTEVTAG